MCHLWRHLLHFAFRTTHSASDTNRTTSGARANEVSRQEFTRTYKFSSRYWSAMRGGFFALPDTFIMFRGVNLWPGGHRNVLDNLPRHRTSRPAGLPLPPRAPKMSYTDAPKDALTKPLGEGYGQRENRVNTGLHWSQFVYRLSRTDDTLSLPQSPL
jgi:hypothetical protein